MLSICNSYYKCAINYPSFRDLLYLRAYMFFHDDRQFYFWTTGYKYDNIGNQTNFKKTIITQSLILMKIGVLPLNVFVSIIHLALSAALLYALKLATKPLLKFTPTNPSNPTSALQPPSIPTMDYNKLIAISFLKKYTLIGSFFSPDKKYLLKEMLMISTYTVACLGINHIIIWPLALVSVVVPSCFLLFDILLKKIHLLKIEEVGNGKNKTVNKQTSIELEIQSVNIQSIHARSTDRLRDVNTAKIQTQLQRTNFQLLILCGLSFATIVMFLQTVMTLGNSISNSGQLNILSLLIIVTIDQFAVRITLGLIAFGLIKLLQSLDKIKIQDNLFVNSLCSEQVTDRMIQLQKLRLQKQREMTASPTKKKHLSPSKVPKAVLPQKSSFLNLINLQPPQEVVQQDSQIQQIFFTTEQKQMFQGHFLQTIAQNKSGCSTKRAEQKQNDMITLSVHKQSQSGKKYSHTIQIDKPACEDIVILKNDPLDDIVNHRMGEFHLESPINIAKRKMGMGGRKKNKRNLNLTGSSPYLEYLPDMLKKVDKFKNSTMPAKDRKML